MPRTAKLFRNGRSQAIRLPAEFRFPGSAVHIRRNPAGEVILYCRPESWESFFELAKDVPAEFMANRGDAPAQKRRLFK